jgi:hypothetical protein
MRSAPAPRSTTVFTDRLFYESKGQIAISALFGLALAFLFRRICKDRKCIVITAPPISDVTSKIYEFEGDCFKYNVEASKCPEDEATIIKNQ